ncbi:MAG: flagellar basal body-associated protein FliL [Thiobacillus sp.]
MAEPAVPIEAVDDAEAAPAGKSRKKLLVVIIALVVLTGGGAGVWYFTQGGHAAKEAPPQKVPVYLALDTFTVNLQGGEQYLQTDLTLQVADQAQADAIKVHMPRVRSRLLTLLSGKQADELASATDKKKLAQEILAQVKQPFDPNGKPQQVDDVLFTSFVIQ